MDGVKVHPSQQTTGANEMKKCPAIGDRVRYPGGSVVGPCVGVVTAIYPSEEWTNDEDNPKPTGRMEPESEWSVGMRPDVLPKKMVLYRP